LSEAAQYIALKRGYFAEQGLTIEFTQITADDIATRWMTAYLKGVRDYNDAFFKNRNRPEIVDILSQSLVVKDPALYDRMAFAACDPDGQVSIASLQAQMDYAVASGDVAAPLDLAKVVDGSFAEAAVARLGPYR
jgi:NitT/TauT family transport system substrate-binding protein